MKTGLPKTSRGHDATWVFVDRLTRRGHVVPCSKNITAPEIARLFFEQVIRLHGVPRVIISDRDPRFTSMFWKELWKIVGTRLNVSTADHAATDGGSERYIGTLMSMLRAYCHDNPYDWDLYYHQWNLHTTIQYTRQPVTHRSNWITVETPRHLCNSSCTE